jgi:hypothetical protein
VPRASTTTTTPHTAISEGKKLEQEVGAYLCVDILDRFLVGRRGDGGFSLLETLCNEFRIKWLLDIVFERSKATEGLTVVD